MNKIQCPHCFTDYKISDEQLRLSQGVVRCGKCMETFDANKALETKNTIFDPREAFIEPPSKFSENEGPGIDDLAPDSHNFTFKDGSEVKIKNSIKQKIEPDSEIDHHSQVWDLDEILEQQKNTEITTKDNRQQSGTEQEPIRPRLNDDAVKSIRSSFDPELSVDLNEDDLDYVPSHSMSASEATYFEEPSIQKDSSFVMDQSTEFEHSSHEQSTEKSVRVANESSSSHEEHSIRIDPNWQEKQKTDNVKKSLSEPSLQIKHQQQEINVDDPIEQHSQTVMLEDYEEQTISDEEDFLIDEVDQLIDDKILNKPEKKIPVTSDSDTLFVGKKKKSASRFLKWLILIPVFFVFIIALSGAVIYQLWQKQLIAWPDRKEIRSLIEPVQEPVLNQLEQLGIEVPVRRNLSALQLLSAKTEAHPTRASTILLRVSLINRAEIDQPLPWLELSLKNSDGKIISRRSLSPNDYIHNNRIGVEIGARELKKITIELLSFPKQAAGYELKLLNK